MGEADVPDDVRRLEDLLDGAGLHEGGNVRRELVDAAGLVQFRRGVHLYLQLLAEARFCDVSG